MAENKVEIKVTADTAQAVGSLGAVEKGAKAVSSSATELGGNAAGAGKGLAQVGQGADKAAAAMGKAGISATELGGSAAGAGKGLAQVGQGADKAAAAMGKAGSSATGLGTAFGQLGPLIAGAFTGRELVQTITQADSLQRGMLAIAGSTEAAAAEMAFIKKTTNELGLELQSTGKAYLSLTAATKGTVLEGQATRDVFTSVSRAMSVLGRSTAETENALRAVSQIASKGTVSMEELRGQLGEALPGAMKAAADGMGVTTQELVKMVESGGVLAKDLLPALSRSLDNLYASGGQTDSLVANFNRFKNAVSEVAIKLGESGLTKALADIAIGGAQAVGALGTAFVGLGKGIGTVAGAMATLDFKPLADDLGLTRRAAGDVEQVMFDVMGNIVGVAAAATQASNALPALGDGLAEVGFVAIGAGNTANEAFRKLELGAQYAELRLSQTAKNAVAEFDKFKASGDTAAEAIAKIGKGFDLSTVPGIKDAAAVLEKLVADGKISALEFNKAWIDSLKGVDLADFVSKAKKAFEGSAQDAGRLKDILDQGLREAVKRTGLDFDVISGGMGKAARSAINDTDAIVQGLGSLKAQGIDTGAVLTASIGKSINTADSAKAIEAVKAQIESLRTVLGNKVTDGLLEQAATKALALGDALDKSKIGVNSLREAMATLGITSDASLKTTAKTSQEAYDLMRQAGTNSARELGLAFAKAANDAIAANNGIAPSWVRAQAGARGYELAVDAAGKTTLRAMNDAANATDAAGDAARRAAGQFDALADAAAKAAKAASDEKYGKPKGGSVTGNTREERLAGQAATDGTGAFALRAKQKAGTLSADDLKTAEAVMAAAEFNKQMYDDNTKAYSLSGAQSIFEELNSARTILDQVRAKQLATAQAAKPADDAKPTQAAQGFLPPPPKQSSAPAANTSSTANTYLVKIDFGGRATDVNVVSANDAKALIDVLQQAKRGAGF